MRIKFTDHIQSMEEMKQAFCKALDSLPIDLSGCTFSGVNFYFCIHDRETGDKIEICNEIGAEITGFTFGRTTKKEKAKRKCSKSGNIINFNPELLRENCSAK